MAEQQRTIREISASVPVVGTILVSFVVAEDATPRDVEDAALNVAADALSACTFPEFNQESGWGEMSTIEVLRHAVQGDYFYGDCADLTIDSDETVQS